MVHVHAISWGLPESSHNGAYFFRAWLVKEELKTVLGRPHPVVGCSVSVQVSEGEEAWLKCSLDCCAPASLTALILKAHC